MVSSVANNAQQSPAISRTFQPGGTEQQRQAKETSDEQSRTSQASGSRDVQSTPRAREESRETSRSLDQDDRGTAARSSSRGSVLDVTV